MLEVVNVTKYYGALAAVRDVSFTARRRGSRLSLPQRLRQVDHRQHAGRAPPAVRRRDPRRRRERPSRHTRPPAAGRVRPGEPRSVLVPDRPRVPHARRTAPPEDPDVLDEKVERFLRLFGIYDDRHARLSAYSKGMRQKILIAAGLLHDPEIVILDEPSSGLNVGGDRPPGTPLAGTQVRRAELSNRPVAADARAITTARGSWTATGSAVAAAPPTRSFLKPVVLCDGAVRQRRRWRRRTWPGSPSPRSPSKPSRCRFWCGSRPTALPHDDVFHFLVSPGRHGVRHRQPRRA